MGYALLTIIFETHTNTFKNYSINYEVLEHYLYLNLVIRRPYAC